MAGIDTDSEYYESGAPEQSTNKLGTAIVHKKCVPKYSRQDFKPSETQSTVNESRRLNKAPKTSAERAREFRARKALLKQQRKQHREPDAIIEIATDDIQSAGPSEGNKVPETLEITTIGKTEKSAEVTLQCISESSKKQAKTAAQRMREYRARKKLAKKLKQRRDQDLDAVSIPSSQVNQRAVPSAITSISAELPSEYTREYCERGNYLKKACDNYEDLLKKITVEEVILRVYRYLQTEYEQLKQLTGHSCDLSPLANILKRTAAATGVSEHTVTSLLEHDQPSDEETSDDDANAKRLRLDIDLDDDLDQKEHIETWNMEQFETETEQEHYGQKEQDNYNMTETFTIKYENYDERIEYNPLELTPQEQTHQEQNRATGEQKQYGVKIKQERHDEASGPSGHILVTSEPVAVKFEPGYCGTTLSVKCEPADQQSSETDPLNLDQTSMRPA